MSTVFCAAALTLAPARAHAIACTTQAEMKSADREAIVAAATSIAGKVQLGDTAAVRASTIPSVAASFDGIASSVLALSPVLSGATLAVTSVYDLNAADAKPPQPGSDESVEFFCGQAANAPHVTFTIPQLPPGHYAFAVVEATGVKSPQRLSMLLQETGGPWKLAGFFPRPLLAAGRDGTWYWERARAFAKANQQWNAFFYYQTAAYLLVPADFLGSTNLDRLLQEQSAATPPGLPQPGAPMMFSVGTAQVPIVEMHTDASFGGLDLVVDYNAANASEVTDPVSARARTVALMKALLAVHPELKNGFHGLWVFANTPGQHPFALELPVAEIESQP
jgi:hypothetical protein